VPAVVIEKPASERFGKTVTPNISRFVGLTPQSDSSESILAGTAAGMAAAPAAVAPAFAAPSTTFAPRTISLGNLVGKPGGSESAKGPAADRSISLQLADIAPHLPEGLLKAAPIDPYQRVLLRASELERGMSSGHPSVHLRAIYQQAPDFFTREIDADDETEVALPFGKVLEQFAAFQVRTDQVIEEAIPTVETPFLQVTVEDSERFRAASAPVPAPVPPPVPEAAPVAETAPTGPIRLPLPPEAERAIAATAATPAAPIRIDPTRQSESAPVSSPTPSPGLAAAPAPPAAAKKIALNLSPNGTGEPASERVPASSGPSVPTPAPSSPAPTPTAAPTAAPKIAFKIGPPSNDLRESIVPKLSAPPSAAPAKFGPSGLRLQLPLSKILRGIAPTQLTGPRDEVPETARIEVPFSIVQPQLSSGKVAISPSQFQSALPEEWRERLQIEDVETPIPLDLQEVLQNLPNESLQIRSDQEAADVGSFFETPFSQKAAEDAARLSSAPVQPVAKPEVAPATKKEVAVASAVPPVVARIADPGLAATSQAATLPKVAPKLPAQPRPTIPATAAAVPEGKFTALHVEFDTDEVLDAKAVVARVSAFPGLKGCAIVFSDGLSLAGNLPAEYEVDALCAMAPAIMKKIGEQMAGAKLGALNCITVFCAGAAVTFFARGNICLAALHAAGEEIGSEIRARLGRVADGLALTYVPSA